MASTDGLQIVYMVLLVVFSLLMLFNAYVMMRHYVLMRALQIALSGFIEQQRWFKDYIEQNNLRLTGYDGSSIAPQASDFKH